VRNPHTGRQLRTPQTQNQAPVTPLDTTTQRVTRSQSLYTKLWLRTESAPMDTDAANHNNSLRATQFLANPNATSSTQSSSRRITRSQARPPHLTTPSDTQITQTRIKVTEIPKRKADTLTPANRLDSLETQIQLQRHPHQAHKSDFRENAHADSNPTS